MKHMYIEMIKHKCIFSNVKIIDLKQKNKIKLKHFIQLHFGRETLLIYTLPSSYVILSSFLL